MTPDTQSPEEILDVNRRWLPPPPHVDKVVEAVLNGSAHIEKRGHHEAPLVIFEDGGVIELPARNSFSAQPRERSTARCQPR